MKSMAVWSATSAGGLAFVAARFAAASCKSRRVVLLVWGAKYGTWTFVAAAVVVV